MLRAVALGFFPEFGERGFAINDLAASDLLTSEFDHLVKFVDCVLPDREPLLKITERVADNLAGGKVTTAFHRLCDEGI